MIQKHLAFIAFAAMTTLGHGIARGEPNTSHLAADVRNGTIEYKVDDSPVWQASPPEDDVVFGYDLVPACSSGNVIVCSPPTHLLAERTGIVQAISLSSGDQVWQALIPAGLVGGYAAIEVVDQDIDGNPDYLVQAYDAVRTPQSVLISGAAGKHLRTIAGDIYTTFKAVDEGKLLYASTDLNFDGTVDSTDLDWFADLLAAMDPLADVNKDGVIDGTDVATLVTDVVDGKSTYVPDFDPGTAPPMLLQVISVPRYYHPSLHKSMLLAGSVVMAGGSTVTTPEGVITVIVNQLIAQGKTVAQMIAILRSMGFSEHLIAWALGLTALEVTDILRNNGQYTYCIGLYTAYKSACAAARGCKGTPDPAKCADYQFNFMANATCAILRSKHMGQCIPGELRGLWDPDGGHAKRIVEAWNAAAKCGQMAAQAGCTWNVPTFTNLPEILRRLITVPIASCPVTTSYAGIWDDAVCADDTAFDPVVGSCSPLLEVDPSVLDPYIAESVPAQP